MSTVIAAALSDGIAVIGLANASLKQSYIYDIIIGAAQKAFGLAASPSSSSSPSSASSSSLANQPTASRRRIRDLPAEVAARTDGAASPSYPDFAGIYYNPGYGTAELCNVASTSPSCQSVLNDFHSVDKSLSANSTDLFSSWDTPISSNIRFAANGTEYAVSVGFIYPEGYGKNSTPFSTVEAAAIARFVVENENVIGFGVYFSVDVDEAGSVEETSDVWFVKQG